VRKRPVLAPVAPDVDRPPIELTDLTTRRQPLRRSGASGNVYDHEV
jgi:hypothetical protein